MATNRPEYRDPKTPRAVKVYTIAQESRYVLFENVPALGLVDNLLAQCQTHGQVEHHWPLDTHASSDEFRDVILVVFHSAVAARKAKRAMDDRPFFANLLRVSYAPEYETVDDARNKLFGSAWRPKKNRLPQRRSLGPQLTQQEAKKRRTRI
ncbi:hypothetical protein BJV82DRAFT_575958 [Fennellomyces sp. T-0311]|nr:hypothetical protein BJV82DRAFT_575958 [Fennellomyces sp. T-0311]